MREIENVNLDNVIFIDIETVRIVNELDINSPLFDSWEYSHRKNNETDSELVDLFKEKAGLYPEFGKIVCISLGRIINNKMHMKSYCDDNEHDLLDEFMSDLNNALVKRPRLVFCGHAAIGFDIPFIFKRCIINGVKPNHLIDTSGLKPWEVSTIDTKDLWKNTSFKPASLINVATALGLPSPKDDISGKEVGDVYWNKNKGSLERIKNYCEKDVLTTANVFNKMRFEQPVELFEGMQKIKKINALTRLKNGEAYTDEIKNELLETLNEFDKDSREMCYEILNSIVTKARGKETYITKKHIKELQNEYESKQN